MTTDTKLSATIVINKKRTYYFFFGTTKMRTLFYTKKENQKNIVDFNKTIYAQNVFDIQR